jgi:hypothetical protein
MGWLDAAERSMIAARDRLETIAWCHLPAGDRREKTLEAMKLCSGTLAEIRDTRSAISEVVTMPAEDGN